MKSGMSPHYLTTLIPPLVGNLRNANDIGTVHANLRRLKVGKNRQETVLAISHKTLLKMLTVTNFNIILSRVGKMCNPHSHPRWKTRVGIL